MTKGKRDNQKMKPFFVMEYLLKKSDENKRITADKIRDALLEKYDISSNVRSIYKVVRNLIVSYYFFDNISVLIIQN